MSVWVLTKGVEAKEYYDSVSPTIGYLDSKFTNGFILGPVAINLPILVSVLSVVIQPKLSVLNLSVCSPFL